MVADRKAPLGWIYLRIFSDSTFEYENAGLRTSKVYTGKAIIINDTIFFNYKDSIPNVGEKAVISQKYITFIAGNYIERVEIKNNKMNSK